MNVDQNLFNDATKLVIKNFEGGYYHPDMLSDGRLNATPAQINFMRFSGETMFGLDRHAGHSLYYISPRISSDVRTNLQYIPSYKYKNDASKIFWTTLDNQNAAKLWRWNYKGGAAENQLQNLAAQILYPVFLEYSNLYFSEQSKKVVYNNPKLLFHFIYAVWNGPAFFRKFAKKLNEDVDKNLNAEVLIDNQILVRAGSAVGSSASKMVKVFSSDEFIDLLKKKRKFILPAIFVIAGIVYYLYKK
jgi:hypothetical protein